MVIRFLIFQSGTGSQITEIGKEPKAPDDAVCWLWVWFALREVVKLKLEDIHSDQGMLAVRKSKGNKDRMVPISAKSDFTVA